MTLRFKFMDIMTSISLKITYIKLN